MILSDYRELINFERRDITETFISNDELNAYLNKGLRKIKGTYQYSWDKVSTSFSYVDGSYSYALSSVATDFDEAIDIFYSSTYLFEPVSPQEFHQLSASEYNIWAIDNDTLLVNTTFGSETLILNYYTSYVAQTSSGSRVSGLSNDTDSPLMPEMYQDIIVNYALSRCYKKEGMYDDYRIAKADFMEDLKTLQTKTPSRKKHYSKRMGSPRKARPHVLKDKTTL